MRDTVPVSLVVPSYRRGSKLKPTLQSIERQTIRPSEIIVVNDGEWPETSAVVARDFPWVTLRDVPHGGAALARNRGVEIAAHDLVMFLDDDDWLEPHATETLWQMLQEFPQAAAAFADHALSDLRTGMHVERHHGHLPAFDRLRALRPLAERGTTRLYGRPLYLTLLMGNVLQQPWMVRRKAFLAVGGFRSGLASADDWDLYLRLTRVAPVALSDVVIGRHFIEPGREHLTLIPEQQDAQMKPAEDHLKTVGWRDPQVNLALRQRLGVHYKARGDRQYAEGRRTAAWREYARSALTWPFDAVVIARLFLWPLASIGVGRAHTRDSKSLD